MTRTIIDTHVHVWDLERATYNWLKGDESMLNASWNLSQLEVDRLAAGVKHGVLVQAAPNMEDTNIMLEAAATADWIAGAVIWLPLMHPAKTADLIDQHFSTNKYVKGVRHQIHDEPDAQWLLQPAVIESLQLLAARGIPFDVVAIHADHIRTALTVAERVPGLRMIFDHLAQPPIATGSLGEWGTMMKTAATHANCYAKISGLGTASKNFSAWSTADLELYIDFIIEQFSPARCCVGGDWPVALLAGSYQRIFQAYMDILSARLSNADLDQVLHGTAIEFYNLQIPSAN